VRSLLDAITNVVCYTRDPQTSRARTGPETVVSNAFRNLLLVSLDTLRADVAYSGQFSTLNRLRREGTAFLRAISPTPLTPPSHATILTGLPPSGHGIRHLARERLNAHVPTLATLMSRAGYATAGIVSSPGLNRWYGLDRDFEHYDDEVPRLSDGRDPLAVADVKIRGTALKRAPLVVRRALEWLSMRRPERFFLFVHFFDAHWPYESPELFGPQPGNPYEAEVAYMDHYFGLLLAEVEGLGYSLDETAVVCISDHGEDLGGWYANDHAGERGHPEEDGHGCLLFDATQHVPLMFRAPGVIPAGSALRWQVRSMDVLPTLVDLFGLACPPVEGQTLTPLMHGQEGPHRPAYCETYFPEERAQADPRFAHLRPLRAVRLADQWKVIWEVGGERIDVYDLTGDPLESAPQSLSGAVDMSSATLSAAVS
jgi:arylsulfatase